MDLELEILILKAKYLELRYGKKGRIALAGVLFKV